jgi:hypothetical protein
MNIIGIASQNYDADGNCTFLPLPDATETRGNDRRLDRTKTLDGGVVITDGGLATGDRSMSISITADEDLWTVLWNIFSTDTWITISTDEACFLAAIQSLKVQDDKIKLNIMVKEDLTV